jgi:hypothetical protein
MQLRKPDFVTGVVVVLAFVVLAMFTFELWIPHH